MAMDLLLVSRRRATSLRIVLTAPRLGCFTQILVRALLRPHRKPGLCLWRHACPAMLHICQTLQQAGLEGQAMAQPALGRVGPYSSCKCSKDSVTQTAPAK